MTILHRCSAFCRCPRCLIAGRNGSADDWPTSETPTTDVSGFHSPKATRAQLGGRRRWPDARALTRAPKAEPDARVQRKLLLRALFRVPVPARHAGKDEFL